MDSRHCRKIDESEIKEMQILKQKEFFLAYAIPLEGEVLSLVGQKLPFFQSYHKQVYGLSTVGVEVNPARVTKGIRRGRIFEIFLQVPKVGVIDLDSATRPLPRVMVPITSMLINPKFGTPNGVFKILLSQRAVNPENFRGWVKWLRAFWSQMYERYRVQALKVGHSTIAFQFIGERRKPGIPEAFYSMIDLFDKDYVAESLYKTEYNRKTGKDKS